MKESLYLCGCGYGKATHAAPHMDEKLRMHVLGEGTCCRMIATGDLIPKDFRMEVWENIHGKSFLTEVCTINNQTVTVYTLKNQRGYNFNETTGLWSLPKNKESINSIGDEW